MPSFCQDRLGTNIGKRTHERETLWVWVYVCGFLASRVVHEGVRCGCAIAYVWDDCCCRGVETLLTLYINIIYI
jgi:hypothetical protein